jgi:hypothetical protein
MCGTETEKFFNFLFVGTKTQSSSSKVRTTQQGVLYPPGIGFEF